MDNKTATDTTREVLKRMIILCWVILAVCFVVKIFGGKFFNIVVNNERFISVCNYIEYTFWYYIVGFVFYYANGLFILLAMKRELTLIDKELLFYSLFTIILFAIQYAFKYIGFLEISIIITIIRCIIIPILVFKVKIKDVIVINIFDIVFQLTSSFVKNIDITNTIYETAMVGLIFLIDYYIMILLLYLYRYYNKEKTMGFLGTWFLSKEEQQKRAYENLGKKFKKLDAKHNNFYKCIFWSVATFWVAIPNTMPITLSLFSSVLIGFVITFILYKVEDYVETKIALKEYTDKTLWVMEENELRQYCRLKGIKRDEHIQFVWLVLQGWTFGQISDKLGYSVDTLKDWSPVCKKKLGITDWNADKNDKTH